MMLRWVFCISGYGGVLAIMCTRCKCGMVRNHATCRHITVRTYVFKKDFKGTILAKSVTLYLLIHLVDDGLHMPSSIYDPIRTIQSFFSRVLLGETINTLSGSSFVDI